MPGFLFVIRLTPRPADPDRVTSRVYACRMNSTDYSDLDSEIIDVTPRERARRGRLRWVVLALVLVLLALWRGMYVYVESLWYGSLGFGSRFWYVLELGWLLFFVFGILTLVIMRGGLYVLAKWFRTDKLVPHRIYVNKQPVEVNVSRYMWVIGWVLSVVVALISA